ncbi:hypothetical protein [Microbacterium gubbeenense]|uniref:hypothetical protein n=1 Tax=Microbacterium gubbeenense TaxID=159896 RepID=UPI003F972302
MGDFPWQKDPDRERRTWRRSGMPWQRDAEDDALGEPEPPVAPAPAPESQDPEPHEAAPQPDPPREPAQEVPEAPQTPPAYPPEAASPEHAVPAPAAPPQREKKKSRKKRAARSMTPASPAPRGASAAKRSPAKKSSTGTKVGMGVALVLVGGSVITGIVNSLGDDDAPTYERTAEEEGDLRQQLTDTVSGYFDAIMEADAARALTYVDPSDLEDADGSLLTDDVLAAAQDRAPIDEITVASVDFDPDYRFHATADVTYLLRGEDTTTTVDLWNHASSDDGWSVRLDSRSMMFPSTMFEGLRPTVYGEPVEVDAQVLAFPGEYEVAFPDSPHLSLVTMPGIGAGTSSEDGSDVAVVTFPLGDDAYIDLGVSASGQSAFTEAVMASIDACVSSTNGDSECARAGGSAADDGAVDGTVARHLDEEFSDLDFEPRPVMGDQDRLREITTVGAEYEATCDGGVECSGMEFFGYPNVDFGTGSARVTWESVD